MISEIAKALNIEVDISKETNPEVIMSYGVMRTPAVVVDENLVHSGSIPNSQYIEKWLS